MKEKNEVPWFVAENGIMNLERMIGKGGLESKKAWRTASYT